MEGFSDRTSTINEAMLRLKLRGSSLQSLGLAYDVGYTLVSAESSLKEQLYKNTCGPAKLNMRDAPVVLAWACGVFSVRFWNQVPKWVKPYLGYRKNGAYVLQEYLPLRVIRYLVSCELNRSAAFTSFWCRDLRSLARNPPSKFIHLVKKFVEDNPVNAKSVSDTKMLDAEPAIPRIDTSDPTWWEDYYDYEVPLEYREAWYQAAIAANQNPRYVYRYPQSESDSEEDDE
jgi:hypothetical protein